MSKKRKEQYSGVSHFWVRFVGGGVWHSECQWVEVIIWAHVDPTRKPFLSCVHRHIHKEYLCENWPHIVRCELICGHLGYANEMEKISISGSQRKVKYRTMLLDNPNPFNFGLKFNNVIMIR